jgi:choline dehydrogenase
MVMGQIQSVGRNLLLNCLSADCMLLLRYFTKFEKYVPDPDYPHVDSASRGSQGPVQVGYFSNVTEPSKAFITACTTLGVPFCPDFKSTNGTQGVNRVCDCPSSASRQF